MRSGVPGARDSDAMALSVGVVRSTRATRRGAPAIRFVTEHGDDIAGVGEPGVTVRAPRFELLRATTGAARAAEIEGYEWDPAPNLGADPRRAVLHDPHRLTAANSYPSSRSTPTTLRPSTSRQ